MKSPDSRRHSSLVVRAQQKAMQVIGVLAPNPKVFETLTLERDLAAPVLSGGPAFTIPSILEYLDRVRTMRLASLTIIIQSVVFPLFAEFSNDASPIPASPRCRRFPRDPRPHGRTAA